jgi:hypothetical protein
MGSCTESIPSAQDERHHGGVLGGATGQAARGHRAAVVDGAEHIGQRRAADTVHRRCPARLCQWPRFRVGIGGQPGRQEFSAIARPMPRAAPVTTATFPSSSRDAVRPANTDSACNDTTSFYRRAQGSGTPIRKSTLRRTPQRHPTTTPRRLPDYCHHFADRTDFAGQ